MRPQIWLSTLDGLQRCDSWDESSDDAGRGTPQRSARDEMSPVGEWGLRVACLSPAHSSPVHPSACSVKQVRVPLAFLTFTGVSVGCGGLKALEIPDHGKSNQARPGQTF